MKKINHFMPQYRQNVSFPNQTELIMCRKNQRPYIG